MSKSRREDILVSVCAHDVGPFGDGLAALKRLSDKLDEAFRYWEILVAVPADAGTDWLAPFDEVPNLRLLRLRQGLGSYRLRSVLAAEAIGDVILIAASDEIDFLDVVAMIRDAHEKNMIVIGDRCRTSLLDKVLAVAGNGGGFRVNARYMQTLALPRGLLTRLLEHPDPQLALRFPPRDSSIPLALQKPAEAFLAQRRHRGLLARVELAQRLIVSSAPNVLLALSVASFLTSLGGVIFLIYVVLIWIFLETVQPGWVTISGILGISATFLGLAGLGLSTGMQKIIALLTHEDRNEVLEEIGQINVFSGIREDLNVHYDRGHPSQPEPVETDAPR